MGEAARYKKKAEEWRELARRVRRAKDRAELERMADEWDQLAAEAKRKRNQEG